MSQGLFTGPSPPGKQTVSWVQKRKLSLDKCPEVPRLLDKQGADEVFGLLCDLLKALLAKLPLGGRDQGQSFCIVVALEGRLSAESAGRGRRFQYNVVCALTTRWQ